MNLPRSSGAAVLLIVVVGGVFALGRVSAPDGAASPHRAHSAPAVPGSTDIGFAQDMAAHHDQAVLMAQLALTRGSAGIRAIAEGILIDQSQEVGLLRGWLRLWGAPGAAPHPMAWMDSSMAGMKMAPSAAVPMPGMATPPQLQRLYNLSGRRFDVLFLQLMIRHHEGGLIMTRAALAASTLGTTKAAARGISAAQLEEIGTMRALLAADGAKQLPAPG